MDENIDVIMKDSKIHPGVDSALIRTMLEDLNVVLHLDELKIREGAKGDWSIDVGNMTSKEVYEKVRGVLSKLSEVKQKGYVNNTDLFSLPIIKELLVLFGIRYKEYRKLKSKVHSFTPQLYKWVYNLIIFTLYDLTLVALQRSEEGTEVGSDIHADLANLVKELYGKLDPVIRNHLLKRGISVVQNIYVGFDSEYKNIDPKRNKLLTVQLAVNTKTFVKIPKQPVFTLSTINPLTQEVYLATEIPGFDRGYFEAIVNNLIKRVRQRRYPYNDDSVLKLITAFQKAAVPYMEKADTYVFSLPLTDIQPILFIAGGKEISFADLVKKSNEVSRADIESSYEKVLILLRDIWNGSPCEGLPPVNSEGYTDRVLPLKRVEESEELEGTTLRRMTRTSMVSHAAEKMHVSRVRNAYFIAHLTNADLSMLSDFEELKKDLDIVNKCYVTLGRPIVLDNTNIFIRDTMLLTPAGQKSLDALGPLYGISKIKLTKEEITNMDKLLEENRELFEEYAMRDAVIPLIHANYMEHFNFRLNEFGIPITLSNLGAKYVRYVWKKIGYKGYQINSDYLIGDSSAVQTPKGLSMMRQIGLNLSMYIANYKGGRNESFMYGVDKGTLWYDYDLTSAYTTAMAGLGHPAYDQGRIITEKELNKLGSNDILFSYVVLKGKFNFPESVKYPSIPCYVDANTTVYPLKGECVLTGAEYLLAKKQGCVFELSEIFYLPFAKDTLYPFKDIIKEVQAKRREFPKGSINNLLYKEMGNSIYGGVVRGMADKRKFDIKTGRRLRMEGSDLSNPILASWTTAFIRSVIGECLHNIHAIGGKVVSVTTDGFVTNIPELEMKLQSIKVEEEKSLLQEYKHLRLELSGNPDGIELKHSGPGIISWTTRGQFSKESGIKATTGFQARGFTSEELESLFLETMKSPDKEIEYIQTSLRSALDLYRSGGHVTMVYKDQIFRLHYDNRREILEPNGLDESEIDTSSTLFDSKPVVDTLQCASMRSLSKIHKEKVYNRQSSVKSSNTYNDKLDLAVRNFVKGLLATPPKYNLSRDGMTYLEIIEFINRYKKTKMTVYSISKLKNRKQVFKVVPRTPETLAFVCYIKEKYPAFDESNFFSVG